MQAHHSVDVTLGPREQQRLRTSACQGGSYPTSTGESVHVLVSESYSAIYAVGQRWADFFASLLRGSELGLVTVYVVTPDEMQELCGPDALNVCVRAQQGSAYPGHEDDNYTQNPGEAFAEVYRVLNEVKRGATTFRWDLVGTSFYPDAVALQAAEQDVVSPGSHPSHSPFGDALFAQARTSGGCRFRCRSTERLR